MKLLCFVLCSACTKDNYDAWISHGYNFYHHFSYGSMLGMIELILIFSFYFHCHCSYTYYLMNPFFFFFGYCSIRLTTFDIVKRLIAASEKEFQRIVEENRSKHSQNASNWKSLEFWCHYIVSEYSIPTHFFLWRSCPLRISHYFCNVVSKNSWGSDKKKKKSKKFNDVRIRN